jgi:1-aminocyclopropane-1-carboxylate deaminase/D-cysteine desulfhydrase-like pyridoxal-dependent ACC family enzyme
MDVWIKRDDLTGFAGGGNKGRKLEYLAGAVLEAGADTVVVCGSAQSNFVRQAGALCAVLGVRCVAVVMGLPFEAGFGKPPGAPPPSGGNVELGALVGVEARPVPDGPWEDLFAAAAEAAREERAQGRAVYEVPVGGSTPLGAYGFVQAAAEVRGAYDVVVVPTSSGSTHAGLAWALAGTGTRVVGVACDPEEDLLDDLARLCEGLDGLLGGPGLWREGGFELDRRWYGAGYGVPSPAGHEAQLLLARAEGVFLDPVYSAKAMAGLLGMAREGSVGGKVLFWHTGGLPAACAPGANAP